jgi:hypothetical protein
MDILSILCREICLSIESDERAFHHISIHHAHMLIMAAT